MKRQYLNTLAALALLALFWGGTRYWEKRRAREPAKTESAPAEKLLSTGEDQIEFLSIRPRNAQAVACRREGGKWRIVKPQALPADLTSVAGVLNSLSAATVDQVVEANPGSLREFGLTPPSTVLELTVKGRTNPFVLRLGDETPTGTAVYAQVEGNPRVFTLASHLKTSLVKTLFDLRDKRVLTLEASQIRRIEVRAKQHHWTLMRNPEGAWDLLLPPAVRADRFTVEGLVDQLGAASMQSVVAEHKASPGRYGFDSPVLRVQVSGPGQAQTLIVGHKEKKDSARYYAMNPALVPVFTLGSEFVTQFQKSPADLRDKELFSFSSFAVKRVEIETPKGRRVFEKQGDAWKQTAPGAKDIAADKMDALLGRLRDLRADSFPKKTLAALGLAKPAYRFQVKFGEKNQKEEVEAIRVGERSYARRSTDPLPSELSRNALDELSKALDALW